MPIAQCDAERVLSDTLAVLARGNDAESLTEKLRATGLAMRAIELVRVQAVAEMLRQGVFAARGYQQVESAVADLLGVERSEAVQVVVAAEAVCPRSTLQGEVLAARLPALGEVFAAGAVSVGHVAAVDRVLASRAAERLSPPDWAEAEKQIADIAPKCTAKQVQRRAVEIVELLDQDGPEPDDRPRPQTNELRIVQLPGGGGRIRGRFDDPVRFQTVRAVLDAMSAPRTKDETRSSAERQADALSDVCDFVARHGDTDVLPEVGGNRPTVLVTLPYEGLKKWGQGAWLHFGGAPAPDALRMMCCDARVIPVVLGGAGQPLDVGHTRRTIPTAIRRAVEVRDRGCAHPGCDRPPSWSEVHHVIHWAHGGRTSVENCVMVCRVHHREIHSTGWEVRIRADGIPEFIPPPWIDPAQEPRRQPHYDLVPA